MYTYSHDLAQLALHNNITFGLALVFVLISKPNVAAHRLSVLSVTPGAYDLLLRKKMFSET